MNDDKGNAGGTPTLNDPALDATDLRSLAATHGLMLVGDLDVNEIGLDFRVVTGRDDSGQSWILRVPRRPAVWKKAEREARTLRYLQGRLPVAVPDWRIATPDLIAYPRLTDTAAITVDPSTMTPDWHIDQESTVFVESLAETLVALHALPRDEAVAAGVSARSIDNQRQTFLADLDRVREELGISSALEGRWRRWIDDDRYWPDFTALTHGDLYVAHTLVDRNGRVTGIIDWTEAGFADPAVDFILHLKCFGDEGLERLITEYAKRGGRTWDHMRHHIGERLSVFTIDYALYALETRDSQHLSAVKNDLGIA